MELKSCTTLVAARDREYNFPIKVYDDGDGPLWLSGDDHGARLVLRAQSFEDAWGIMVDESTPIPESDVPEAYGFYGPHAALDLRQAVERADAGDGEYPDLIEGYEYQPSATGTGIVDLGHYVWMREMTRDDLHKIRLIIRADDREVTAVTFQIAGSTVSYETDEGPREFHSYSVLHDIGAILRDLEQHYVAVQATIRWQKQS